MHRIAVFLTALILAAPSSLAEPVQPVSLDQARALAVQALQAGDPAFALRVAKGLLAANPDDAGAWALMSVAYRELGDTSKAGRAASKAYRYGEHGRPRLQAAQLAAGAALAGGRPTLAQFWLRRAATQTDHPEDQRRIARDYARVRAINPFSFVFRGGIAPSDNVNGGADGALQVIDGVPFVGILTPSAQALSGIVAHADLQLGYRLHATDTTRTTLGARLYTRQVDLSSDARAKAPTASNDDFGSSVVELSLGRRYALPDRKGEVGADLAIGRAWSGDAHSFDYARLSLDRGLRLDRETTLSFSISAEARDSTVSPVLDETRIALRSYLGHKLDNGDRVGLGLTLQDVEADHVSVSNRSASLRGTYTFGRQFGPAEVTAGLTLAHADYPTYTALFVVPGGRQDNSVYADLSFFLTDYDYAGFAPTIRVRHGRRDSNVSRFEMSETSLSLEIRSKF